MFLFISDIFNHKNNDINTENKWFLLVKILNHFFQKALKWFVRETCKRVEKLTGKHLYSSQWSFVGDTVAQRAERCWECRMGSRFRGFGRRLDWKALGYTQAQSCTHFVHTRDFVEG